MAVGTAPELRAPGRVAVHSAGQGMALQALHRLGELQQTAVRRAVRVVTDDAVLDCRWMFEHMGAAHVLMAFSALLGLGDKRGGLAVVRVVATDARQRTFDDRMVGGHGQAGGDILVAADAQGRNPVALPHADIDLLDLGGVDAVAVPALDLGFVVFGKGPVHAPVVVVLVAGQALFGRRQLYAAAATFSEVPGLRRMAGQAVAVIDVDLVRLVRYVAGFAGLVADGGRLLRQGNRGGQA